MVNPHSKCVIYDQFERYWFLLVLLRENLHNFNVFFHILLGNPGLGSMYQDFMSSLHCSLAKPDLSIWAFSYIGHDSEAPTFLPTGKMGCAIHSHISLALAQVGMKTDITFVFSGQTYILEDQILHKLALL